MIFAEFQCETTRWCMNGEILSFFFTPCYRHSIILRILVRTQGLHIGHAQRVNYLSRNLRRWSFFLRIVRTCLSSVTKRSLFNAVIMIELRIEEDVMFGRALACIGAMALVCCVSDVTADEISDSIKTLQSIEPGGVGTAAGRSAIDKLAGAGSKAILPVLKGFKGSDPLAINWPRNAFEEVVDAERKEKKTLPADVLEAFILDRMESPIARRLAYETLRTQDPGIEARLIPDML